MTHKDSGETLDVGDRIEFRHGPFLSTWEVVEIIDAGARLTYCGDVRFVGYEHLTAAPNRDRTPLTVTPEQAFLGRAHWPAAKRVSAMTLEVQPLDESNGPGWRITRGRRSYVLWAPRPARNHGWTFGGLPVVTKGRDDWAVGWDALDSDASDYWKGATLDEVLAPLPGEVADAFAAAVDEWRRKLADDTATNVLESALQADDSFEQAGADDE